MRLLTIICSKDPTNDLIECVEGVKQFYPSSDILIIDSNSKKTETYKQIDVPIYFAKNVNYEFGAWKIGYAIHNDYDAYLCIQDTLKPVESLAIDELKCDQIVTYFNLTGFRNGDLSGLSLALTRNTKYYDAVNEHRESHNFRLAQHNSFLIPNGKLSYLINTLPNLPINKRGSMAYERVFGLAITHIAKTVTNMGRQFIKVNGKRM